MKIHIALGAALALLISLLPTHAGELLKNGDFMNQLDGWWLEQHSPALGQASFEDKGPDDQPAIAIELMEPGDQAWQMALSQKGFAVQKGKSYKVTFWAKAEPMVYGFFVSLGQASKEYRGLANKHDITLNPMWKQFEFDLVPDADEADARLLFGNLAKTVGKVWLASVSLTTKD